MYDFHKCEGRIDTNWSVWVALPVHVPLSYHSCVRGNSPLTTMLEEWSFGQNRRSWTLLLLSTRYSNLLVCMHMVRGAWGGTGMCLGLSELIIEIELSCMTYGVYLETTCSQTSYAGPQGQDVWDKRMGICCYWRKWKCMYIVHLCTQYICVHHRSFLLWKVYM